MPSGITILPFPEEHNEANHMRRECDCPGDGVGDVEIHQRMIELEDRIDPDDS